MNRRSLLLAAIASPLAILCRFRSPVAHAHAISDITDMKQFILKDIAKAYNLPASILTINEARAMK